ncbi:MAG: hypothetical protein M1826_001442 [Phylliscum demangeonii]|nr:MAG: hypothetical protein M1826_001442 [Phylliscum demangeonii]
MHFRFQFHSCQFLLVAAPLLVGQAVGFPRPAQDDTSPRDAQPPKDAGAGWNPLSTVLGAAGLLVGGRAWHLHRQAQAQLGQQRESLQTLRREMDSLRSQTHRDVDSAQRALDAQDRQAQAQLARHDASLRETLGRVLDLTQNNIHAARREAGISLHELKRSTRQSLYDLHRRIDGTSGAPALDLSQLVVDTEVLTRVLREHPHLWHCAVSRLQQKHADRAADQRARYLAQIRSDERVEVLDWIDAVNHCDARHRFPDLRPTQATPGWLMPLPDPQLSANTFASVARLPARLHTAAQRSMKALAKQQQLGATLLRTEKTLGRQAEEELQAAVRRGV